MCHRDLLLRLHQHLLALRQARDLYAPKLAPELNAIGLCSPDELRLSFILKELLSPKDLLSPSGSHAQGAIFLELFLNRFELVNFLPFTNDVNVSTEKTTDRIANRMLRMDIHLDFGPAAIAIENKPWAGDQKNQRRDYLEQLKRSHPALNCLIYLSGSGEPPSTDSISKYEREDAENDRRFRRFKIIAYPQLIDWLKDCRRECQADRVSFFLNEFIDYIQKQFVGIEMAEMQEVVNIALETPQMLEAALEIANAHHEIRFKLLDRLEQQLRERVLALGWTLEWNLSRNNYWNKYSGFRIKRPQATLYSICFEFNAGKSAGFIYGIAKTTEALPNLPDVNLCLNQDIAPGRLSQMWPWYWNFPGRYWNWDQTVEPWLDIQSGAMTDMIMEKTQAIYTALENANLLGQLGGNAAPPQNYP
jgi:hypothetical protein